MISSKRVKGQNGLTTVFLTSDASLLSAGGAGSAGVCKLLILNGGQGRNRTADAGLFRAALYQLSYLANGD